jgi:Arm DNA-binding domain
MVRAAAFKRKLNALTVQRAKPRTRAYLMWDTLARGLALRVQPTGRKSFCVIYRSHGRPRWLHLGDASVLPLSEARELAVETMLQVIREQRTREREESDPWHQLCPTGGALR